jgi:hypothetical protein
MRGLRRLPSALSPGLFTGFRRMRDGIAVQELVEQERDGGRRRPVDGSDRSGLGLGRRTARRGALRARTPAHNRRAATHATRSGARGTQKLQTAPSGRKPGTQAARRSQALAPPSRSEGAASTSAPVDRSGPAGRREISRLGSSQPPGPNRTAGFPGRGARALRNASVRSLPWVSRPPTEEEAEQERVRRAPAGRP